MYLAELRIRNYRCFADQTIKFVPGVNVLLGENNAGKTTAIKALRLVLDQQGRRRPTYFDFHHPCSDWTAAPAITITITFRSSDTDHVEDKALVATWLTKLEQPWEATVTYTFMLEPEYAHTWTEAISRIPTGDQAHYRRVVESFLDKYVTRTFGGDPDNQLEADRESLGKITLHTLDALRDAERELFSGTDPLLKRLLKQVRDEGKSDEEKAKSVQDLHKLTLALGAHIRDRIDLEPLLSLVNDTGAMEGGRPHLADDLNEEDLLYALRLYVLSNGVALPAELNGLGYNNLLYISLVLASLDHQADPAKRGTNASIFPLLSIEEPEAHLHPALQYKLLKHIEKRVEGTKRNRQVLITTHSTHITSASPLDQLVVFTLPNASDSPRIAYPGRCFGNDANGKTSKAYIERYLDATKSNLLFSKGVLLVEGIAEQLLLPVLAEHLGFSFAEHHVALVPVGGITFKHFLPLFGAGLRENERPNALNRTVACVIDADPSRKPTATTRKFRKCFPYDLDRDPMFTYKSTSDAVASLTALANGCPNILIACGAKTLEYDLALENHNVPLLVTDACAHAEELRSLFKDSTIVPESIGDTVTQARAATAHLSPEEQNAHVVATCYLRNLEDAKGEHALALAKALKEATGGATSPNLRVPPSITSAIRWVCKRDALMSSVAPITNV